MENLQNADGFVDSQAAITSSHGKLSGSKSLLTEPWVAVAVHKGQGVMLKEMERYYHPDTYIHIYIYIIHMYGEGHPPNMSYRSI